MLDETFWLLLAAPLLGLCVGSFLNVVIHRLPRMMENEWRAQCAELSNTEVDSGPAYNLATPRSACPHCNQPIRAVENIPIISFLMLGGRCAHCKTHISARYPIIEGVTALLSFVVVHHFGATPAAAGALLLLWSLIALAMIDLDTQLLPDAITLPLLWLGIAFNLTGTFTDLESAVLGAMAGYLALWSIFWLFKLATGKEGMGYGDFKLLAALGAWLGWKMLPVIILLSSCVGAVVGIALIVLTKQGRNIPIPFGPYLSAAGLIALFWGKQLTETYLALTP